MQLTVYATVNQSATLAQSNAYGNLIRIVQVRPIVGKGRTRADSSGSRHRPSSLALQVALENSYQNTTSPQTNFTASIPWSRASSSNVGGFSAACYFTGLELVLANATQVRIHS